MKRPLRSPQRFAAVRATIGFWAGFAAFASVSAACNAQTAEAAQVAVATPAPTNLVPSSEPDVQIVAAPLPNGQWGVTEVYSHRVAHADIQRRLQALRRITGWAFSGVEYDDSGLGLERTDGHALDRNKEDRNAPADPVTSSVTFQTQANVVDFADGTINLTPFAFSLHDLSHVNMAFLVPQRLPFLYRGIRSYEDSKIAVHLAGNGQQGTYYFLVNIKDHQMTTLSLPRYAAAATPRVVGDATQDAAAARRHTLAEAFVAALAISIGALAYGAALKYKSAIASPEDKNS